MRPLNQVLDDVVGAIPGKAVAERIKKSPSYISQIRSGKLIPPVETLAALARAFGKPALLAELLLAAEYARLAAGSLNDDKSGELKKAVLAALDDLAAARKAMMPDLSPKQGRSLLDFPEAFYPMVVVTGDKREDHGLRLTAADLGAYSATPADTRWFADLGLRGDVVKHIDKNFVLLPLDDLITQFSHTNLLVVGSPAANHLARMINSTAIFRFNYRTDAENAIRDIIAHATRLPNAQLIAFQDEQRTRLATNMRSFFTGGIFDPLYLDMYVTAEYSRVAREHQLDFGVLTLASNPFYEEYCRRRNESCDHRYVSIMAAGIHHPATAHALRLLGKTARKEGRLDKHPFGGVIRVVMNLSLPFATRTIEAECVWEDKAADDRKEPENQALELITRLGEIEKMVNQGVLKNLALKEGQAAECQRLLKMQRDLVFCRG